MAATMLMLSVVIVKERSLAYDNEILHPLINEHVYRHSPLVAFFQDQLGINLETTAFGGRPAVQHMRNGGTNEDDGTRWLSHFHDPLRVWASAGLWGSATASPLWAQEAPDFNEWTWQAALQRFRRGLTEQRAKDRNRQFAELFRNLGQLTHLVADMSVPEHVRNDAHPLRDIWPFRYMDYEGWCQRTLTDLNTPARLDPGEGVFPPHPDNGQAYYRNLYDLAGVLFTRSRLPGLSPVSNLWDSWAPPEDGQYNPALGTTAAPVGPEPVGLAEYTNFNYLSWDTRHFWESSRRYEHPSAEHLHPRLVRVPLSAGGHDEVVCFGPPQGGPVTTYPYDPNVWCVASTDLHWQEWLALNPGDRLTVSKLDQTAFAYYAVNLVPRAIAYGVALVDYFFRGRVEVEAVGDQLTVRNPSELALDGRATVYADAPDGTRARVSGLENLRVALAPGASLTWTGFAPPPTPDGRYLLVFEGEIEVAPGSGARDAAVAGRSFPWVPPPPSACDVCPAGCAFASIQAAIVAASAGSQIVVCPGTYGENLDFRGKALHLRSAEGPWRTVVDGGGRAPVVTFSSGEGFGSVLEGFTLTGGAGIAGGIFLTQSSPTIVRNVIRGNTGQFGGGILVGNLAYPVIVGNWIAENRAELDAGGFFIGYKSLPTLYANTVYGNVAEYYGGAWWQYLWDFPLVRNSIFWGNTQVQGPPSYTYAWGDVTYSNLEGWPSGETGGEGNTSADPRFVHPAAGDLHLRADSPCRDAGTGRWEPCPPGDPRPFPACLSINPFGVPAIDLLAYRAQVTRYLALDIDGAPRPQGAAPDQGAHELLPHP